MARANITQVRQLRNELGAHTGGFAVATDTYRKELSTRRLVPFTLTTLALAGYRLRTKLEESVDDPAGTMLILGTQEGAA